MPTRSFFNDPAFAQAAANLSQIFAPPSGADAAGWARAKAEREQAEREGLLWQYVSDPNFDQTQFDRMGIASGRYNPSQSYYAVDLGDATTRRGQDVTAATSRANNAADNARAMQTSVLDNRRQALTSLYGSLAPGHVAPAVPEELMNLIGMPAIPERQGAPRPVTQDELQAAIFSQMSPEEQQAIVFGNTPVENIVTPEGPRIATRRDAVGQQPFINPGATAKPTNATAVLPDGSQVPAVQDPATGRWRHAQTGAELPADVRLFNMAQPQGTADEVGLTGAMETRVQQQVLSLDQTLDTARRLRTLVDQSPSSQGLVGALRGTAQDIIQTGGELGQFFGGQVQEAANAVNEGLMDAGMFQENFDPSIPAIQMMTNLLAWQYAKSLSGDRVSNEQLRQAREALGGTGMFANRANTLTRLDQLIGAWENQREQLRPLAPNVRLGPGVEQPAAAPIPNAQAERWERGPDGQLRRAQ